MAEKKKSPARKSDKKEKAPKADMNAIRKMEQEKREEALKKAPAQVQPASDEISFDQWHMMRAPMIPTAHRKEILRADFGGRGLGDKASQAQYDEALGKYGIKLKK